MVAIHWRLLRLQPDTLEARERGRKPSGEIQRTVNPAEDRAVLPASDRVMLGRRMRESKFPRGAVSPSPVAHRLQQLRGKQVPIGG